MSSRYYDNTMPEWAPGGNVQLPAVNLKEEIQQLFNQIFQNPGNDSSVYTGVAGYAYLCIFLAEKYPADEAQYLERGLQPLEPIIEKVNCREREITFLCGNTGPQCVYAVLLLKSGRRQEAEAYVHKVLNLADRILKPSHDLANELLYGRAGYLFSVLFLQKYFPELIPQYLPKYIAEVIINQGSKNYSSYLMWEWHGKQYLGGAHGVAGIVYLLLQVEAELTAEHKALLENTVDYLLANRFSSGNLRSSVGSTDDRLVHWCHGAPGFVQTLLAAYRVWHKPQYYSAAKACGEVVWAHGLLKKGFGICHGVAGNAYTFVALYQATGEEMHLHRAVQFARWCIERKHGPEAGKPDRPLSLFEGKAGTLHFLVDIQKPLDAVFPCYSVKPFTQLV